MASGQAPTDAARPPLADRMKPNSRAMRHESTLACTLDSPRVKKLDYLCSWGPLWFPEPRLGFNFEVSVVGVDCHEEVVQEALKSG